jgi:hypothetical protein
VPERRRESTAMKYHYSVIAPLLLWCVLSGGAFAQSGTPEVAVSTKKPSTDSGTPVSLAVGEVVRGRLGNSNETGKFHFWLVDLSPGTYKLVLDVQRADDRDDWLGGELQWFSLEAEKMQSVGGLYTSDHRSRGVYRFSVKKPFKLLLRYSNNVTVSDYWIGLFREPDRIVAPFFANPPAIEQMELGRPARVELEGGQPFAEDKYYSIQLDPGDYKVGIEIRRADGRKDWLGGQVAQVTQDGDLKGGLVFSIYDNDFSSKKIAKLSLADEATLRFRVRATNAREIITFTIDNWVPQQQL